MRISCRYRIVPLHRVSNNRQHSQPTCWCDLTTLTELDLILTFEITVVSLGLGHQPITANAENIIRLLLKFVCTCLKMLW